MGMKNEQDAKSEAETTKARRIRYAKQCLIVMTAALVSIPAGMIQLWPNVLTSHLARSNLTLFGNEVNFAPWQMDLVGSITQIGSLVGFLAAGYLVGRVGRRWSLVLTAIPGIFGSALITFALNTHMIIVGRFLDGITNGMMNVAVFIYASEISDVKIRGGMCMLCQLLVQIGGIATISFGVVFSWYYMSFACGCFLVFHCLMVSTLEESPSFLAVRKKDERALKILRNLRGTHVDVEEEVRYLQSQNQGDGKSQGYAGLLEKQHLQKIGLMSGIFFIHNFCGTQVLRINANRQLQELGLSLDDKITTIMVIVILFFGNLFMTIILDCYGRRRCIMTSLVVVIVSYTTLGAFIYLLDADPIVVTAGRDELLELAYNMPNSTMVDLISDSSTTVSVRDWLPLLCLMLAAFGHSMGIGPLVWVLSPEMFPTNLRSQGTGVCTMIGSLQTFAILQLYSPMQALLTQAGLYWFYSGVALLGIFFIYFFLTETTGERVG